MRHQSLNEFDERDDGFELVGEERPDEEYRREDRRLPKIALSLLAMAIFAGGLWFAYHEGTRHAATAAPAGGVPLIRADQSPAKVKPEQPGGMAIPDQNVSIYNEKPNPPTVENLLPPPEKPMPRPAPEAIAPPPAAAAPAPAAAAPPVAAPPPPAPAPRATTAAPPPAPSPAAKPEARPTPEAKRTAAATHAEPPRPARTGPVQVRLASVRTPEAARIEWARLRRENPDLLGRLSAVAVRTDLGDKGIYYRIEAGPFADAAAAERLCSELRHRKLGCILAR